MATERGDPLLSIWRYGLGNAAAFTSDAKSRWAAEWVEWEGFSAFWAQVMRTLLRQEQLSTVAVRVEDTDDGLRVVADVREAAEEGLASTNEVVEASIVGPDLNTRQARLTQQAPGRFVAVFPGADQGDYHVQVTRRIGGQVTDRVDAAFVQGYPPELRLQPTDEAALRGWAGLTEGRFDPAPPAVLGEDRRTGYRMVRLWPALLSAAVVLLVVDVALRRIEFGGVRP